MKTALLHLTRSVLGIGMVLVLCSAIGFCSKARAEGFTVGLHLATAHFGGDHLQASTPGVYGRVDSGPLQGLTAGTYRNSYSNQSSYLGWSWQTADSRFALTVGGITGYSAGRVMPLLVPSARIPITGGIALRVAFFPKPVHEGHAAGLHLAAELAL